MTSQDSLKKWSASPWFRYGLTVAAIAVAFFTTRVLLDSVDRSTLPYMTYFPALVLASAVGGLVPGLLALGLAVLLSNHGSNLSVLAFAINGLFLTFLCNRLHIATHSASRLLEGERKARDLAEEANRSRDEFLATLSHELRTPLNAILGWSQLLQAKPADDETTEGLAVIVRNARTQTKLIDDMLDMSRILSGRLRLEVEQIDLAEVIELAVKSVQLAAGARGISLRTTLDARAGQIAGDPNQLQQIVWNLLTNAIKFTPEGGRVQVTLHKVHSHIELVVSDTGEGIAPEFLPYVFDRFRQADATTTRRHGGVGLGLAIVKELTEMHGGRVRVESRLGKGSTFIVELPPSIQIPAQSVPEPVTLTAASRVAAIPNDTQLQEIRILVVDDEPDARDILRILLKQKGATVVDAAGAAQGIELLKNQDIDLVICDIGMPGVDGYEFVRRLRGDSTLSRLPVIAVTAFARSEDRKRAIQAGFDLHLSKPIEPTELVSVISDLAGRLKAA